jgi:hypothetical protein
MPQHATDGVSHHYNVKKWKRRKLQSERIAPRKMPPPARPETNGSHEEEATYKKGKFI